MIETTNNYCATIGFFDGVHRGHREVIRRLQQMAAERKMQTMVITFGNHPMEVVRPGFMPQLLITCEEKVRRLYDTGIDRVEILRFTKEMMQQSAREFMQFMYNKLGVRVLVIGYDNRFGKRNPDETFDTYVAYGKEIGIEVIEGPRPESCGLFEGKPVSSSLIRQLIKDRRLTDAEKLM